LISSISWPSISRYIIYKWSELRNHLIKPNVNYLQVVIVVLRALLYFEKLGLDVSLFALVFFHLSEDGVFLKGLQWVLLLAKAVVECEAG